MLPPRMSVPPPDLVRPAEPAITELIVVVMPVPVEIVGVAALSVSVPLLILKPLVVKVRLCAVAPVAATLTVPAVPWKTASFPVVHTEV